MSTGRPRSAARDLEIHRWTQDRSDAERLGLTPYELWEYTSRRQRGADHRQAMDFVQDATVRLMVTVRGFDPSTPDLEEAS